MRIAFDDSGTFKNEKSLNNVLDPASNCLSKFSGKHSWWSPIWGGIPGLPTLLKWIMEHLWKYFFTVLCNISKEIVQEKNISKEFKGGYIFTKIHQSISY